MKANFNQAAAIFEGRSVRHKIMNTKLHCKISFYTILIYRHNKNIFIYVTHCDLNIGDSLSIFDINSIS